MPAPKLTGPTHSNTLHLGAALDQNPTLTGLLQRLQQSRQRFAAIREELPPSLRDQVRPGPLDDTNWSLLVSNGAAASKLRQLQPTLEAALFAQGFERTSIRVKVQSRALPDKA